MDGDAEGNGHSPDKRQFLVVIDAEVIRRTKILAIERHVTASSIVQQALTQFFDRETPSASRSSAPEAE